MSQKKNRMVRTQIYLTAEEHKALKTMSAGTGKKQSELIREAIDDYLAEKKIRTESV